MGGCWNSLFLLTTFKVRGKVMFSCCQRWSCFCPQEGKCPHHFPITLDQVGLGTHSYNPSQTTSEEWDPPCPLPSSQKNQGKRASQVGGPPLPPLELVYLEWSANLECSVRKRGNRYIGLWLVCLIILIQGLSCESNFLHIICKYHCIFSENYYIVWKVCVLGYLPK